MIESDDPDIRRLATRLVGDLGPREAAHKLEAWVHENVHYRGSGVGLASARRTLRSRDGDCTENAFLLTALLRAAEIPARVVVGLAYAGSPGAFIPHAWVEAWMPGEDGGGAWGSLDSALYRAPADSDALPDVDAAHLAMAKTAGGEEGALLEISAPILNGLGRFDLGWVEPQPPDEPPPGGTTGVSTGGSRISPPSSASSTR